MKEFNLERLLQAISNLDSKNHDPETRIPKKWHTTNIFNSFDITESCYSRNV